MLIVSVVAYLVITLAVGFYVSRWIKSTEDFTLAGRSLSSLVVGVTLFATWFGPELIMGVPSLFIKEGVQGIIIDQFGNFMCLMLVGFFYARQLYRLRVITVNDFFRMRYNRSIEVVTSIMNVMAYFWWIASQFVALALLFHTIMGVAVHWGIIIGASVVLIYTYIGGMWAVSITDLIQSLLIVMGLAYLLYVLLDRSGGLMPILNDTPKGFYRFLPKDGFYNWTDYFSKWLIFGIGALPAQEIYQRTLSARSEKGAASGAFLGAGILFVVGALPLIIGLAIYQQYPELAQQDGGQNLIPAMVFNYMELPVQVLFFGALISAILSTSSGAMLAPATVIGENIIKPFNKNISDKKLLLVTRLCVVGVAIVAGVMALFNSNIHGLMVDSTILLITCFVAPFTLGIYWKKASVNGVWSAMGLGLAAYLLTNFLGTRIDPLIFGLLGSTLGMVAGSFIMPDNSYKRYQDEAASISAAKKSKSFV